MALGICTETSVIKTTEKELILNDKVVNYLYKVVKNSHNHYVHRLDVDKYEELTPQVIKRLLDSGKVHEADIVILDDHPEYPDETPFEVKHASPYDHRWPGDYDEDAYDDWEVVAKSLGGLFYEYDSWADKPYYAVHPEEFDFTKPKVSYGKEKVESETYEWGRPGYISAKDIKNLFK